jgi:hypothetical protein
MLTLEVVTDKIEVLEDGVLQVRYASYAMENGERVFGPNYSRRAYAPGDSVTTENARVQAVAGTVWTPQVVDDYRAKRAAQQALRLTVAGSPTR